MVPCNEAPQFLFILAFPALSSLEYDVTLVQENLAMLLAKHAGQAGRPDAPQALHTALLSTQALEVKALEVFHQRVGAHIYKNLG